MNSSNSNNNTSSDNNDYIPIDCAQYSRYELAIMQRERLRIAWQDWEGHTHLEALSPINLRSHNRAEFLLAKNRYGRIIELRLDRIKRAQSCLSSG